MIPFPDLAPESISLTAPDSCRSAVTSPGKRLRRGGPFSLQVAPVAAELKTMMPGTQAPSPASVRKNADSAAMSLKLTKPRHHHAGGTGVAGEGACAPVIMMNIILYRRQMIRTPPEHNN